MKLIPGDRPLNLSFNGVGEVAFFDLSAQRIANCAGCFGCWTKTPGKCVIRDDPASIYPLIAQSDTVLYISRLAYGAAIQHAHPYAPKHCCSLRILQRRLTPRDAHDADRRAKGPGCALLAQAGRIRRAFPTHKPGAEIPFSAPVCLPARWAAPRRFPL